MTKILTDQQRKHYDDEADRARLVLQSSLPLSPQERETFESNVRAATYLHALEEEITELRIANHRVRNFIRMPVGRHHENLDTGDCDICRVALQVMRRFSVPQTAVVPDNFKDPAALPPVLNGIFERLQRERGHKKA